MRRLVSVAAVLLAAAGLLVAQDKDKEKPQHTAAEKEAITKLAKFNVIVLDLAQNDNHLDVSYLQKDPKFSDDYLAPLKDLKGSLVHLNLGKIYAEAGRKTEAEAEFRQAAAYAEPLHREHPKSIAYAVSLGGSCTLLGHQLSENGKEKEAIEFCSRAIDSLEGVLREDPLHPEARIHLRAAYGTRAYLRQNQRQYVDAAYDWQRFDRLQETPQPAPEGKEKNP